MIEMHLFHFSLPTNKVVICVQKFSNGKQFVSLHQKVLCALELANMVTFRVQITMSVGIFGHVFYYYSAFFLTKLKVKRA